MSIAQRFNEKRRTDDVLISESVDFAGLLLTKPVLQGLTDAGFQRPSPVQLKAIPLGRCGLDLIVQAKSGTGKTCVFTVIALESLEISSVCVQVLVLAPTREIAQQIKEVVRTVGSAMNGLKCHTFIGGLPVLQDKILAKNCHIAIGTPGRVKQLIEIGALKTNSVRLFVLDEADKLLEAGFQESINWIYSTLPENKQIVALSATYPEYLAQHLTSYMRNPTFVRLNVTDPALIGIKQYHVVVPNHPLPNIVFNAKTEAVVKILSSVSFQQCLIFSNMQTRAQNLQSELQSRNWPTACIAGCLDQKDRTFAMEQLKTYKCRILISTDLTSRGIDADKVNLVINMDVPQDHETYLHRIGRAGRFGSYGAAITIVSSGGQDKELWAVEKKCKTYIHKLPDPIPKDLVTKPIAVNLDDMVSTQQIINCPEAETSLLTASSMGGRNLQHGHVPDSSPVGITKKDDSNENRDLNKSLNVENVAKDSTAENCTSECNQLSGKDVKTESACDRSHVTLEDTDSKGTQPGTIFSLSIEKILEVEANEEETVIEKCSAESGGSGVSCDQTGETVERQIGVFDDSYHQTCVLQLCLPDEVSSKLSIVNHQRVPDDLEHLQHKGSLCGDKWKFRSPRKEETTSDNSSQECVVSESEEVNIYYDKGSTCSLDSVVVKFEKVKLTESGESQANGTGQGETVPCCEQELKSVSETTLCATPDLAQFSNDIQSDGAISGCENSFCQNSCTGDVSRNTEISSGENVTQKLKSYVDDISKQILQEAIRTRPCLQDIKTRALQLIGSKAATIARDDKMNDEVDDKMNDEVDDKMNDEVNDKMNDEVDVASSNKSSGTSEINLEDIEASLNCGAEENLMSECKSKSDQLCMDGNLNLPPACEKRDNSGSMDELSTENSIIPPFVQEIIDLNSPQKVVNPLEPPLDSVSKPMTDDETGSVTTLKETKVENLEKVSPLSEVTSLVSGELIKPANSGNKMEVTTISEVSCRHPAGDKKNKHDGNKTFSVSDQVTMAEKNFLFVSASAVEKGKQSIPAETQTSSNSSVLNDNNLSDNLASEPEKAVVGSPPDAELSQLKAVSNDTLPRNLTDNSVRQESSSVLQENAIGLKSEVTAPNVLLDGLSIESDEQNTSSNIPTSKAVKLKERTVSETLPSLSQGERKSADVGASASAPALSENKLEKTQTATLSKAGRHSSEELSSPQTDRVPQEQTSAQNSHRVIAKPKQRRGAPRSFAVSDFLHLVNEDLHSFKTMNISNSTENELECKSIDASQAKSPLISAEGVMNGACGDIDLPVAERGGGDCVKEMPNLEVVSAKEDEEISTVTNSNDNLSCCAALSNHSCQADLEGGGDYHKYTPFVLNMSGDKHLSKDESQESDKDTSRSGKMSITSTSASDMDDKQKEPSNEERVPQEDVCKIVDKKVTSISKDDICLSDTRRQVSKPDRVQLTLALNSLLLEDHKVQKHSSMKDLEQDFEEYCQNVDNEVADLINHMNSTALVLSEDLQELCLMEETKLQQVKEDYKEKLAAAESARKAKPEVDESKRRHDSRSDSDGSQRGSGKRKTTPVKEKYRPPGRKELPPQSYEEMLNQYQQDRHVDYKERSKRTKSKFSKHSDSLNWRTGAPQKDFGRDERHQNSPGKSDRNQTAKELNDEKKATNKHVNQKKDIVEKQADVSNGPDGNKQEEKGETVSTKTKQSKQLKQSNEECRQLDDMHSAMLRRRQERKAAKLKAGENGHKENVTEDVASTENSKSERQGSDIDKNTDNNKPGRSERQHADGTRTNLHQPLAGPVIKGESLNFEKPVEPEDKKRVSDNVISVAVKEKTLNMASSKNIIEEKSVLEGGDKMSASQLTDVIPAMKEERSSIDVSLADEPHKSKVDISTDAVKNQDFSAAIHSQQPVKKKSPVQRKLFDQGDKMQANEPKNVMSKFTEPPNQTTMKPRPEPRMIVSAKAVERQNKPMQPSKSQTRLEGIKASEGSTSLEPQNQKAVEPLKTDKVVPTKDVGRNDKPTKPSKSEARLAGIEVSTGSTSSSSELSLSSTSDVSDVASSDVENREVGLKQQCYANKYVQDDDDNIMKNRKSHNKFEADANVVETLKHSQKQVKALKKLQDYELRKKHYQSDAVVAPEMFGLMYPQHPYYATYDGDQCLKDFSASHSLSWHPKKLSSHNTHKKSASRRNRDSSSKDPSHSTVGCSTFYVPCNSEENITKKKLGNSTNSKRKERSYPSHAPALKTKESKQQPVLTPEFLSDESSGSESEDEDSSSVPQDYYSHYVQTQIQQQQQQFAFQPPFSYSQQFPYPFCGLPQYPCYPPQTTPSPYPYQANPAFHGMMPAYPPPLPSMSYPQPASHYNHQHYTYLPQQQAPPHYQPSFEMPTKELSLRSFSLQLKYVKHMTKTLSGLAKKHKISDH